MGEVNGRNISFYMELSLNILPPILSLRPPKSVSHKAEKGKFCPGQHLAVMIISQGR